MVRPTQARDRRLPQITNKDTMDPQTGLGLKPGRGILPQEGDPARSPAWLARGIVQRIGNDDITEANDESERKQRIASSQKKTTYNLLRIY